MMKSSRSFFAFTLLWLIAQSFGGSTATASADTDLLDRQETFLAAGAA